MTRALECRKRRLLNEARRTLLWVGDGCHECRQKARAESKRLRKEAEAL